MSTCHIQPYDTFKIGKRDKECVLGIYENEFQVEQKNKIIGISIY